MIEPKLKKKNLINRIIKKQLFITLSTAFLLIFILVGSSYAILNGKTETGVTDVIVQSGNLTASISSEEGEIIEMNYTSLGVSNEVGLTYDPYTFSVENTGQTTIAYYELRIVDKEYELSNLPHKSINYALSKDGGDYTEPQNLGDNKSYIYVGGPIAPGESDDFNLKMWVNEEFGKYANNKNLKAAIELTLYSDVPTRNYIIYDTQGGSYIAKTNVSSKRVTNQVPLKEGYSFVGWSETPDGNVFYEQNAKYESSIGTTLYAKYEEAILITYNLNGGTGNIAPNDIKLGITTKVPTKAGFTFLGWATTETATTAQYESGDAYDGEEAITLYAVWTMAPKVLYDEVETTLASYLLEPDGTADYDARFVSGSKDDENLKNYVWYSGKMWRIIALNNNGTIKLVTADYVTTLAWDGDGVNTDFSYEGSYVYNWLNDVFLNTLYNYNEFVVTNYPWNASLIEYDANYIAYKPNNTTIINTTVGMLNVYEYQQSYAKIEDFSFGYLNTEVKWWLLTPDTSINESGMEWVGYSNDWYTEYSRGVKPSIVLKENIEFVDGTGTYSDPYILSGDLVSSDSNKLLNSRINGEYLKYNDILYRIQGIENINDQEMTKVISLSSVNKVKQIGSQGIFSKTTDAGLALNNWYSALPTTYKNMIATDNDGVRWYQGIDTNKYYDYTKAKQGTAISATIGLPYIGEMYIAGWVMTKYDKNAFTASSILIFEGEKVSQDYSIYPTFYLKSNVKITGGTGLPNDPYEIAMD